MFLISNFHVHSNVILEQCILAQESVDITCDSIKLNCKLCAKKFVRKMMRNHIGFHIVHNDCSPDPHRCGYCGEIGCNIDLVVTSGYGRNVKYGPRSDCEYYTDISKRADNKFVKSYPCSNRPVKCEQCETVYWSYNLTAHYSKTHPNIECPTQISSEESGYILNKKQ